VSFDFQEDAGRRLLLGLFFFPALWLLCRKHLGDLIVGVVIAGCCALLFRNSPNASIVLYLVGCAVIRGGRLERGVTLACVGVFLLFLIEAFCSRTSLDTPFLPSPAGPPVSPQNAAILKLVLLIGFPHLMLGLWPVREEELAPEKATERPTSEILDEQCEAIRKCAAEGEARDAVPVIAQMLQVTEDDRVRLTCVSALRKIGASSDAVTHALEWARDHSESPEVKAAAGEAIAVLEAKEPSAAPADGNTG